MVTLALFLFGIGIAAFASRGIPRTGRRFTKQEWLALVGGMVAVLATLFTLSEIFGDWTVTNWPLHPIAYILGWSTGFHAIRQLRHLATYVPSAVAA